jgi:putative membrane protein
MVNVALLDESARTRIEIAIGEVERHTSGEVVVATVPASDDYTDVALAYGAALAIAVAAATHWLWPSFSTMWLLSLQCGVVLGCMLAFRAGAVLRALVPKARLTESVERRAREAFLEHALFATRERTGVLILISELEHRVAILGDEGINAHVRAEGWHAHVERIVAAVQSGRAAEGICEVIAAIGAVLTEHLPARVDDTDELDNRVRSGIA